MLEGRYEEGKIIAMIETTKKGTLLLILEPAEEVSGGARNMIKDGLFTRFPRPDFNLAFHKIKLQHTRTRPRTGRGQYKHTTSSSKR